MPIRTRKTFRRKPVFRRRRRYVAKKRARATTNIVRAPSAFPDRTIVKLNYVDLLTIVTAGISTTVYRGNDLYDPYYAAGGHQPMGFDEYMGIYGKFTCFGSKIQVWGGNNSGAPTSVAVRPTLSSVTPTYFYEILERPRTKHSLLSYSEFQRKRLTHYTTTAQVFGEKKSAIMSEDNFSGDASTSPANSWYWHVTLNSDSAGSTTTYLWVKIVFYVMFHDRKPMALS